MNEQLFEENVLHGQNALHGQPVPRDNVSTQRLAAKSKSATVSDLVVDGLLQGMAAGFVMLLAFLALGLREGHPPLATATALGLGVALEPAQGVLMHLALSAGYGILWSLLVVLPVRRSRVPLSKVTWLALGVGCGIVTWALAESALATLGGPSMLPWPALLLSHILFGGTLGLIQTRLVREKAK